MKVLTSIKTFALRIWHMQFLKYAFVCAIGVVIVGFLDDNSVWSHMKNLQRISELKAETEKLNENTQLQRDLREPGLRMTPGTFSAWTWLRK